VNAANAVSSPFGAHVRDSDALVDAARRLVDLLQLHGSLRKVRVEQNADERHAGHELAQKPEPLRLHEIGQERDAGCVVTGAAEAVDQAEPHRITTHSEHDGNGRGCALGRERGRLTTGGGQYRHAAAHQFGCHVGQEIVTTARPTKLDREILALNVTALGQTSRKSGKKMCGILGRARA
jgi:hypothetical protein